jgi:hypothetical protein
VRLLLPLSQDLRDEPLPFSNPLHLLCYRGELGLKLRHPRISRLGSRWYLASAALRLLNYMPDRETGEHNEGTKGKYNHGFRGVDRDEEPGDSVQSSEEEDGFHKQHRLGGGRSFSSIRNLVGCEFHAIEAYEPRHSLPPRLLRYTYAPNSPWSVTVPARHFCVAVVFASPTLAANTRTSTWINCILNSSPSARR